ncbi:phosphomannomutase/phosphoglucomutase [Pigmentiphaga aceris]|uniref:Phosphomannomutase/phosphoglucomutase n=1 Tax=Pigmentiphaga aceris TaxID=1940612 RepID=A0A5C0B110_9BURK|nr:phosphomannomutase/phosphoglucomutase [Pigmentiphaga aceris]QEI08419.1 phosphomannomutase/phosphoglucomutase [Pigmentiphaga aceris]
MSTTYTAPDTKSPSFSSAFKAYDIRGVVDTVLTPGFAYALGGAYAAQARERGMTEVVVGRDGRLSGPALSAALIQGLTEGGINVIDIGMVPTPLVYFAAVTLDTGAGIAITGSHNPPQYNGFKMVIGGDALYGDAIQSLRARIEAGLPVAALQKGTVRNVDIVPDYIARIVGDVKLARPIKVIIDAGNGIAGAVAPALMKALGAPAVELFCDVDGTFPNHHPDPADPHNLEDVARALRETDAEIGLAFDGDGDRLGVVTKSGQIIWPDRQLILYAKDVLSRVPGAQIIYDVKCSRYVAEEVRKAGGEPLMWRTGHSLVKAKLKETGAPLAGEMSGHVFFKERWYGFDDGLYAAARLLEILSRSADPSAVLEALPQAVSTPELKLETGDGEQFDLVADLQEKGEFPGATEVITIDGVRAEYPDGFGLARPSNTTPVVVLRFEANDDAALKRIQDVFRAQILRVSPDAKLPF